MAGSSAQRALRKAKIAVADFERVIALDKPRQLRDRAEALLNAALRPEGIATPRLRCFGLLNKLQNPIHRVTWKKAQRGETLSPLIAPNADIEIGQRFPE